MLYARLLDYNPRIGNVLQRFTHQKVCYLADQGWYKVEKKVGEYLETVRQKPMDPNSKLAFEVVTEKEAKTIDKKEAEEKKTKRSASNPIDTTLKSKSEKNKQANNSKKQISDSKKQSTDSKESIKTSKSEEKGTK